MRVTGCRSPSTSAPSPRSSPRPLGRPGPGVPTPRPGFRPRARQSSRRNGRPCGYRPARIAWSLAAIILTAAILGLLAFFGRLGWFGGRPSSPADRTPAKPRVVEQPREPQPSRKAPTIVVRPYVLEADGESEKSVATLKEAVKAATGRKDVFIELRNDEPLVLEPDEFFDLASGTGRLEILPPPGTRPVIEVPMGSARPFLKTGLAVSVKLSGLTIRARYAAPAQEAVSSSDPVPVIQAGGPVEIDRCAFEVAGRRHSDGCRALFMDGGSLKLDGAWFQGFDAAIGIRAFGTTVTQISQTMIVPGPGPGPGTTSAPELRGWALSIELQPGGAKRKLTLDHCTIEGAGFLSVTGGAAGSPLPMEIKQCAVRVEAMLAWQPPKPGDRLEVDVGWKGAGISSRCSRGTGSWCRPRR